MLPLEENEGLDKSIHHRRQAVYPFDNVYALKAAYMDGLYPDEALSTPHFVSIHPYPL